MLVSLYTRTVYNNCNIRKLNNICQIIKKAMHTFVLILVQRSYCVKYTNVAKYLLLVFTYLKWRQIIVQKIYDKFR